MERRSGLQLRAGAAGAWQQGWRATSVVARFHGSKRAVQRRSAGGETGVTPKITLYGLARVPFTEKCRRALVLKRLAFELREPAGPEDFQRWSPKTGLLPVMTVGDELVSDSTSILLRLEELCPDPPLLSTDPIIAAQQRHLEDWADESFLFYYQEWLRAESGTEAAPRASGGRERLRRLAARLRPPSRRASPQAELLRGLEDRLTDLINFLGARPFFYSDRVSMADLTVYAMLRSLHQDQIPGAARLLSEREALLAFMRRVEEATGG
jgi:glutathione S-transferase